MMNVEQSRLSSVIDWHYDQLKAERSQWRFLLDHLAGEYYGPQSAERQQPTVIQLLGMALRTYASHIAVRSPRAICTARPPAWKHWVEDSEIFLNNGMEQDDFGRVLREVVDGSMLGVGTLYTGVEYTRDADGRMRQRLINENCDLPDMVWDVNAKRFHESDFMFTRKWLTLDDIRENEMFGEDRGKVTASPMRDKDAENGSHFRKAFGQSNRDLYDYASVWCGYLRREERYVIFCEHQPEIVLYSDRWNGPDEGPFRTLAYEYIAGSPMPISPAQRLLKTHRGYNVLMTKALHQQQAAKFLLTYTTASQTEAKDVVDAVDNQSVLQENGAIRGTHIGGAAPDTVSMSELCKQLFSYAAGNLDSLAGLQAGAPTLGQERLMADSSSDMLRDMQEEGAKFVRKAVQDRFWFGIRDPYEESAIDRETPDGTAYQVEWTPEKRAMIRSWSPNVDINPYSMRMRTPESRLADVMGAVQIFMGLGEQAMAQGISFDVEELFDIVTDYRDLPELKRLLIKNQDPQTLMQSSAPRNGAPPPVGRPNGNYTRRSESDGSGKMQELMRSFGRNQQQVVGAA